LGYLALLGEKQLSDEEITIARRFVEVFEFSYTRFLDIIRAEAQAREAEIQLALERVRARTMAMQKSNELAQASAKIFSQLNELGIKPYWCYISIVDAKEENCQVWSTTNSGNVIPTSSALPLNEFPLLVEMFDGWKSKRDNHKIRLFGNDQLEWTKYISKYGPFDEYKKENLDEKEILNSTAFFYNFYFKQGFFTIHSKEELADNQLQVIQRFTNVFEQTFTRFLDLVNAEKQNRIIQEENKRKTEELEEARQLQLAMLPKDIPQLPNLEIAVYMKTATEVGGDYYDFKVDENGELTAVIGDATGHGMKAGTIVTITKSMFNSLASENNILSSFSRISKVIKDMKFKQLSMCLLMIKIDGNELSISSAAMPPVFIYRNKKNTVEEFELRGMPLGTMLNFPYKLVGTKIHSGDTILLMSDGLPELLNDKKYMYGYEHAKNEFKAVGNRSPNEIVEYLKCSAYNWANGTEPDDDITFVVIKVK
jgi:serine phosphatase RsbU (regulator of sigma subunit)